VGIRLGATIGFGKHKSNSWHWVLNHDPEYIQWALSSLDIESMNYQRFKFYIFGVSMRKNLSEDLSKWCALFLRTIESRRLEQLENKGATNTNTDGMIGLRHTNEHKFRRHWKPIKPEFTSLNNIEDGAWRDS
jgi:hypothetical protein